MNDNAGAVIGGLSLLLIGGSLLSWVRIVWRVRHRQPLVLLAPRLPVPWVAVDMLILALSFLCLEILAANVGLFWAGGTEDAQVPSMLATSSAAHLLWFAFAVVYLLQRGAYLDDLGWDKSHLAADMRTGFWLFLAAIVPVMVIQVFFTEYLGIPSKQPVLELARHRPNLGIMVLATFAAVGVAPWLEEFVFRVVLQGWLEAEQVRIRKVRNPDHSEMPGFAPLLIASSLFAAMHAAAGPDPAAIFVLSLFLGYAYRQTHRILPSIVIHTGVNGWTMLNMWIMYFMPGEAQ